MDYALVMKILERFGDLLHKEGSVLRADGTLEQAIRERTDFKEGHHKERVAFQFAIILNRHDIGMLQVPQYPGFKPKSFFEIWIFR